jgi:hypothetical protein
VFTEGTEEGRGGAEHLGGPAHGVGGVVVIVERADGTGTGRRHRPLLSETRRGARVPVRHPGPDLGGVTIMDSSGVNTLLTTHRTARSTGGRLRLAAPSASVARLFQIVGLG